MPRVLVAGTMLLSTLLGPWAAPAAVAAPSSAAERAELVDFNGDSLDDLAVGVALDDVGDRPDAGLVSLLQGTAAGLQGAATVYFQGADLGGARVGGVPEAGDLLGAAVE